MKTDVVILCGGRGTRLGSLTETTPKPLLPVGGAPFLLHRLEALKAEGFTRIFLAVYYLADQFRVFARNTAKQFPGLTVIEEPEPLGTGGALRHAAESVRTPSFVAMNGDSWLEQPIAPVVAAHQRGGAAVTMVVVRADRVEDAARHKGLVRIGPRGELLGFQTTDVEEGWVNAGLYVLDTAIVRRWPTGAYSFEERLMKLIPPGQGRVVTSSDRLLDIGTPACYARANEIGLTTGVVS